MSKKAHNHTQYACTTKLIKKTRWLAHQNEKLQENRQSMRVSDGLRFKPPYRVIKSISRLYNIS